MTAIKTSRLNGKRKKRAVEPILMGGPPRVREGDRNGRKRRSST